MCSPFTFAAPPGGNRDRREDTSEYYNAEAANDLVIPTQSADDGSVKCSSKLLVFHVIIRLGLDTNQADFICDPASGLRVRFVSVHSKKQILRFYFRCKCRTRT